MSALSLVVGLLLYHCISVFDTMAVMADAKCFLVVIRTTVSGRNGHKCRFGGCLSLFAGNLNGVGTGREQRGGG